MAVKKYYAVARGRKVGIFTDWPTTERLVRGYQNARYKSFTDRASAEAFIQENQHSSRPQAVGKSAKPAKSAEVVDLTQATAVFFTDGGSRNTGNVAGGHVKATDKAAWAYLIEYQGQKIADSAGEYGATNNRMEIMALRNALQKFIALDLNHEKLIGILDSRYVLDAVNKGWLQGWQRRGFKKADGTPPLNVALWQEISQLLPAFTALTLTWTKGHATNTGNVYVDQLLNQTMDQMQ
ncbi:ribonuclease H family protein [Agrilactobacillus yilanensis]|uniref:ribonuclease H n=1 Tax=Agrilactobacillus yilanensis TaxID=2485997 RepID=A0ABW4J6Z0_9LACO|nr:ribonuclease H family protein [Agrilactobacillus yilanensis]